MMTVMIIVVIAALIATGWFGYQFAKARERLAQEEARGAVKKRLLKAMMESVGDERAFQRFITRTHNPSDSEQLGVLYKKALRGDFNPS